MGSTIDDELLIIKNVRERGGEGAKSQRANLAKGRGCE
jgi:hypothetical protein